ncbi:MAG: ATP-binding protein [Candidatus Tectomicrobia bacterium]
MRLRSIRTHLTLWYTSLLTVTLLLLGSVAYGLLGYSLSQEVDAALHGVARALGEQARRQAASSFPSNIEAIFRRFFGVSPFDRYFQMLDPGGRRDPRSPASTPIPLSREAQQNAARGIPTFETIAGRGPYPIRVLLMPVVEGGHVMHLIQVGMSLESLYVIRRRFLLIMAVVLPLALLLAGGGGWVLAHRALTPVARMTEAARRISAEHLAERLEETGTGDELDRLATTLNAMLGRLDDAFRQIRQFSADASHELQTPLTILKGELEVALRARRTPEAYQALLHSALEEIDRIAALVDGLMLLARADAGVLRLDRQLVELDQLVHEVHGQTKVLAEAQNITLRLGAVEPMVTEGDYERLRRLLLNLVENGLKYTPAGGQVTLSLRGHAGWTSLQVSDTGFGLSPAEQEHVFQRFYRAAQARTQGVGGSGLGLCIALSIAEGHGGSIQLDSTPGCGSTFTVHLPLPA